MGKRITLRLTDAELGYIDAQARKKGVTRTDIARHVLLQNVALDSIKTEIGKLLDSRLADVLAGFEILVRRLADIEAGMAQKDDLIKATNYLTKELKK